MSQHTKKQLSTSFLVTASYLVVFLEQTDSQIQAPGSRHSHMADINNSSSGQSQGNAVTGCTKSRCLGEAGEGPSRGARRGWRSKSKNNGRGNFVINGSQGAADANFDRQEDVRRGQKRGNGLNFSESRGNVGRFPKHRGRATDLGRGGNRMFRSVAVL